MKYYNVDLLGNIELRNPNDSGEFKYIEAHIADEFLRRIHYITNNIEHLREEQIKELVLKYFE